MAQLRDPHRGARVAVVVSCTNSKTLPVSPGLRVADLEEGSGRLQRWNERVEAAQHRRTLRSLYAGAQWAASLELEKHATQLGYDVDLWVISAGLGVMSADAAAPAYAASFAPGVDAVAGTPSGLREWWECLSQRGSSFRELAAEHDQVLVVLAPTYLDVVMPDLAALRGDRFAIVSSLKDSLVYSSVGLRPALGASSMNLNARAAAALLGLAAGEPIGSAAVRARWDEWRSRSAQRSLIGRRGVDDDEVSAFIEARLAAGHASRSALLAAFRGQGTACEQTRFQRLYEEVARSRT
jgi:hypothetical protein